jgi:hypothetical protein
MASPPWSADPLVVVVDEVSTSVGRDHDTVVGDVQQTVARFDGDRFAGEVTADVMLEDADAPGAVDPGETPSLDVAAVLPRPRGLHR